jgi:hypothetical protein
MMMKKYHRRYPDYKWDYKAVSKTIVENGRTKEIIYYTLVNKGKRTKGVEIYSGKNYIVGSNAKSYSRNYTLTNYPKKYKEIVKFLIKAHATMKWSKKKFVDLN